MSDSNHIIRDFKALWSEQCKRGELYCYLCGNPITSMHQCNAEHWIPKSLGGRTDRYNIKPAHIICNSAKSNMTPEEWDKVKWNILGSYHIQVSQDYNLVQKQIDSNTPISITCNHHIDDRVFDVRYNKKERQRTKIDKKTHKKITRKAKRFLQYTNSLEETHSSQIHNLGSYNLQQPYTIGGIIHYVTEDTSHTVPQFNVKEGIVIGVTYKKETKYALVKDFYRTDNGKIESQLLEVLPLSLKQAQLIRNHQAIQVQQLLENTR